MAYTFAATKQGYANLWAKAKATNNAESMKVAKKIIDNEGILMQVQNATDVPWWLIGAWLYRESDLDFNTYLGNGQSIHHVTTIVPKGRGPFATFQEGAIDAIRYEDNQRGGGFYKIGRAAWTIEYCLWASETWNGWGYTSHNVNSPYIWDWTDLYTTGLFVADGQFSPTQKENRAGVAALMMALFDIDPSLEPSQSAQEKPMATTPTTTAAATGLDVAGIAHGLETVVGFLPVLSKIFPPLAPVAPFIPLIQGLLKFAEELPTISHDPQSIADLIGKHLSDISAGVQAVKAQLPGPTQNTSGG